MDGFKRSRQTSSALPPTVDISRDDDLDFTDTHDQIDLDNTPTPVIVKKTKKKWLKWFIMVFLLVILAGCAGAYFWYQQQLTALNPNDSTIHNIEIKEGSTATQTAKLLKDSGLIRSELAFDIYTRVSSTRNKLRAGTCKILPSESVEMIVKKLTAGCVDFKSILFYPGATLTDYSYRPTKQDVTSVLLRAGYKADEIQRALNKTYAGPLFADKPASADLEGYVYGETYYVDTNATVEQVLQRTFDEMYDQINKNDLIPAFKKRGLNLYEAITLASIIQREVSGEADMKQVAQVFLKRLAENTSLGSDVTFIYAAHKQGVLPTTTIDSPYNTRIHYGLPPGPIASPGIAALKAVADPADGDYVFFLAGDDGKTYFAYTQAEHEQNIADHCQKLCSEL